MDRLNFAAIDVGSNAVRLLIKGIYPGERETDLSKVFIVRVPLRLGQDAFTQGRISTEKTEKLLRLMRAFSQLMQVYNVLSYRACATSAMRDSSNGPDIVRYISERSGVNIEIINGLEEARIVYDSHIVDELEQEGNFIYVDVGGGSTEISVISNRALLQSQSYNIGTVRILNKKISRSELFRMYRDLRQLKTVYRNIAIIGSGGNINKLHHLADLPGHDPLTVEQLLELRNKLNSYSITERMERFGLKPDRADVIVPAADIYLQIATHIGAKQIWVPTIGIVDGIIYTLCSEYLKTNAR
ncbi:MAG TPA: Ppx/GppA family phosphatase [Candidatus Barnesiella excrementigallinarum]|nr:Ppx/GppA family phosphatase [Candidatus Barnesiella excrementigallinarum]